MDCVLRISTLCTGLLVLTLRVENKTTHTEYWCQWDSVQGDLCCTCFLIDCLLQPHTVKKGFIHHPPVMSFYMQTQFRARHLKWAVSEKDKDWAAIIAYYVTVLQDWRENEADAGWRMGVGEGELGGGVHCIACSRGPFASSYPLASLTLHGKHWINDGALSHSGKD